eukprot:9183729-Pyramimonas_sp.AAC.1
MRPPHVQGRMPIGGRGAEKPEEEAESGPAPEGLASAPPPGGKRGRTERRGGSYGAWSCSLRIASRATHIASSSGSMGRPTATRILAKGEPTGPEDRRKRNKAPNSGCGHPL